MALQRIAMPSPNYSSRGGATVRLVVLHTAEGSKTIESLGNYFASSSSGVSSQVGIDDKPNTVGEYVRREYKSWTQASFNPVATSAELCGFAAWSAAEWNNNHAVMLENTAKWVAEECAHFGLPIVALTPSQAQSGGRGVCQHIDLGSAGGGHVDCGSGFPYAQVLEMAGGQPSSAPSPPSTAPPPSAPAGTAPPWPGVYLRDFTEHPSARTWQAQMQARGWAIDVDGMYGPGSADVCRSFQSEKGLDVDGVVGPETWAASWTAPIT
jgi:hypothetical protein